MSMKFVFPLVEAVKGFSAVLPHASKDDVHPVITGVAVFDGGLLATDRYTVGQYTFEGATPVFDDRDGYVLVEAAAAEWVAKMVVSKLKHGKYDADKYVLSVEVFGEGTDREVLFSVVRGDVVERSQLFDVIDGNFPPVARLVADWRPSPDNMVVSLKPSLVKKVLDWVAKQDRNAPVRFQPGGSEGGKPGPVRFEFDGFVCLVQPNLILGDGGRSGWSGAV